ncbi:Alpha/Beta hydrolase protein [Naematelia encephala]|uniref:Alpha/Beta hydrolase protein n=1 Tax=Naematelia encephala TaxID=71784 RepID=A0A1Y2AR53_9TREE|nr:Alpha/Beta hydrolase protein [Naematelia encephala]
MTRQRQRSSSTPKRLDTHSESSSDSDLSSPLARTPPRRPSHVQSFFLPLSYLRFALTVPWQLLFAISGMLGFAHFPRQIVRVTPRTPATFKAGEQEIGLNQWVERNVPSLKGVFKPSWLLPNGHLQTMYSVVGNFSKVDIVQYTRTYLRAPDNGTIGLDFAPLQHDTLPPATPTIVVCHGLTGGSHESYVRNIVAWAIRPRSEGGLNARAVVVNFRGCAGVPITSPRLYSAGTTIDLATSLHYLRHVYPESPLHGIGFSLGGSVLSRYLGEAGSLSLLSSGCVIGCPWDIPAMSIKLETHWFTSRVYSRAMAQNLLRVFFTHYDRNPAIWDTVDSPVRDCVPQLKKMRKEAVTLKQVDELMTSKIGGPLGVGLWPFAGADEYYKWASPNSLIGGIKIPTLAINAFDDPIIDAASLPLDEIHSSSHVYLAISGGGGHLGWFTSSPLTSRKTRWVLEPISEWFRAICRDIDVQGRRVEVLNDDGGWTWVKEPAHKMSGTGDKDGRVGWKVLAEGELEQGSEGTGVMQGL